MKTSVIMTSFVALGLSAGPALGQTSDNGQQQSRQQERVGAIFNALFGDRMGTASIDAQWAAGRTPLTNQRAQFDSRVDDEVRAGTLSQSTGTRLKTDYASLVQLEARYGADRRFTSQERTDLADRYGVLTQVLVDKGYGDEAKGGMVSEGRADFERRVDAGISARRLSRVEGARLKTDYAAVVDIEAGYLRDGTLSTRERDDLDSRLDALDMRVGDTTYGTATVAQTPRLRLDAIARALPASGLSSSAKAQLQVEHGDLSRLEAAYGRTTASADDRAYLDRRLADLEARARVSR